MTLLDLYRLSMYLWLFPKKIKNVEFMLFKYKFPVIKKLLNGELNYIIDDTLLFYF